MGVSLLFANAPVSMLESLNRRLPSPVWSVKIPTSSFNFHAQSLSLATRVTTPAEKLISPSVGMVFIVSSLVQPIVARAILVHNSTLFISVMGY